MEEMEGGELEIIKKEKYAGVTLSQSHCVRLKKMCEIKQKMEKRCEIKQIMRQMRFIKVKNT